MHVQSTFRKIQTFAQDENLYTCVIPTGGVRVIIENNLIIPTPFVSMCDIPTKLKFYILFEAHFPTYP
jgi:hypothetical protein